MKDSKLQPLQFGIPSEQPGFVITFPLMNLNNTSTQNETFMTNSTGFYFNFFNFWSNWVSESKKKKNLVVCKFWDSNYIVPNCSENCLGGWSSEGVQTQILIDSINCVSQHLTVSFSFSFSIDMSKI